MHSPPQLKPEVRRATKVLIAAALDRFNRRHPWSHNDRHIRWVGARVAEIRAREVLDIGCWTGNLLSHLRFCVERTVGMEPDRRSGQIAKARFKSDPSVTILDTRFAGRQSHKWPAITAVAVLHHMPLEWALRELRESLAPGGRLIIVGCYQDSTPVDALVSVLSSLANPVIGLIKHPRPAKSVPDHMNAHAVEPRDTLATIRTVARRELPTATIRRCLFWRYTLIYDHPG
ncbi:class I SAM-dependent methyltransferase [Hoyosella sp. YIM 151337]|nr:class I SAM-dependent methyltransferase [Hoyosella sp. YIM 151337]